MNFAVLAAGPMASPEVSQVLHTHTAANGIVLAVTIYRMSKNKLYARAMVYVWYVAITGLWTRWRMNTISSVGRVCVAGKFLFPTLEQWVFCRITRCHTALFPLVRSLLRECYLLAYNGPTYTVCRSGLMRLKSITTVPFPFCFPTDWSPQMPVWDTPFCCRVLRGWSSSWRTVSAAIPRVPRRSLATPSLSGTRTLAIKCQEGCATRPVSIASCVWLTALTTVSPTTAVRRTSVSWRTSVSDWNWSEQCKWAN